MVEEPAAYTSSTNVTAHLFPFIQLCELVL